MPNITLGGHNGEEDYQAYGVTFLFTPNDRFEALLTIEKMDDQSALAAYNQNFNVAPGVIPPPPPGPNTTDFSGGLVACAVYAEACKLLRTHYLMLKMIHNMMLQLRQMQ